MVAGLVNKQGIELRSTGPTKTLPPQSYLYWDGCTHQGAHQGFVHAYINYSGSNPRDRPPTLFKRQKESYSTFDSFVVNITGLHMGSGVPRSTIGVRSPSARYGIPPLCALSTDSTVYPAPRMIRSTFILKACQLKSGSTTVNAEFIICV